MSPFRSVPYFLVSSLTLLSPVLISGNKPALSVNATAPERAPIVTPSAETEMALMEHEADELYASMALDHVGLDRNAFLYAWRGYKNLAAAGRLFKKQVLSICDYSQSSRRKRLYIIDVERRQLLLQTYVAHGRNSGGEYARAFSNRPESHKSSLGFFVTTSTYLGGHGLALNLEGQEKGINDRADDRKIVIHGSRYVSASYLRHNPFIGRSLGCPAVPARESGKIIQLIKNGSCFFIYHPSREYLTRSKVLNS